MLIEEKPLDHWINNFYGYGSWNTPIWFVAYEEGGGDLPEEVAEKLNFFYREHGTNTPSLCDIRELYKQVALRFEGPKTSRYSTFYDFRFGNEAVQHGVWKNLIAFEYGFRGKNPPDLLAYQKQSFASASDKNEALIRLFPLPSPHGHAWFYSWLHLPQFPFLKSRSLYEQHVYKTRMHSILNNIKVHKPEVVLMYGMNNINALKQSVAEIFPTTKFKMVKAVKQLLPQHHRAEINGTILLITTQIPALRHNRIETGFNWEEFGKVVKSETDHAL